MIPELLGPAVQKQTITPQFVQAQIQRLPVTPALSRLLSRSSSQAAVVPGFEAGLFDLFGAAPVNNRDLPVAAVTRLAQGAYPETQDGSQYWWLRADPVHLQADLHQVLLFDSRMLAIESHEAQTLIAEFNRELANEGCLLEALSPDCWYLRLPDDPAIDTHPLPEVIAKDINPLLPQGLNAKYWRALLTEIQMLFYNSEINQKRELDRQPIINSVWFWGGGVLPADLHSPVDGIYGNDLLTRGLARCANHAVSALPDNANDWLLAAEHEQTSLVVLDSLRYCFVDKDYNRWSELIEALEKSWFEPCLQALSDKRLATLVLYPVNGQVYTIRSRDLRRFWRRSRPLLSY